MQQRFIRQSLLIGDDATEKLSGKRVALFGVGGVGSYAAEALARCGVGHIELIDADAVSESNINRQLCALTSTVGLPKVSVVASRLKDINPDIKVSERAEFFLPENSHLFDFSSYDFVIDAIDTVSAKIEIAVRCTELGIPMISCMGTGNKLDPTALCISDLAKTEGCPLARVMRRELKKRGISHLPVIYSKETPIKPRSLGDKDCSLSPESNKPTPASIAFVPSVAGLYAASVAVKTLIAAPSSSSEAR